MKYLTILLASLFIISCNKADDNEEKEECTQIEYNTTFSVILDDEVCFPDGSGFIVKTITDEFCPCLVVCVWEGELKVMVETIEANGEKDLFVFGSSSYRDTPNILSNAKIESFTYNYKENESLPDCENEYDAKNVTLSLIIKQ